MSKELMKQSFEEETIHILHISSLSSHKQVQTLKMNLLISFRGIKTSIPLLPGTTVGHVKSTLANSINENDISIQMAPQDIKLLHKGKVFTDPDMDLSLHIILSKSKKSRKDVKLIAMGVSKIEMQRNNQSFEEGLLKAPRIRDDLSSKGKLELARRRQLGRQMLHNANQNKVSSSFTTNSKYGFHRIETLPMLPNKEKAKEILNTLANDPGILACMAKHQWHVGCLMEMFPEGKVGESPVCVMGENQNKGQKILLRLRTDDLKGFRKILSIRKVLFHELSHNIHSEHNEQFFQLMRQVERECNEMNWTKGNGQALGGTMTNINYDGEKEMEDIDIHLNQAYIGGSGKLGGGNQSPLNQRELAARAAMRRMTAEEAEIQQNCGCGLDLVGLENTTKSKTTFSDIEDYGNFPDKESE